MSTSTPQSGLFYTPLFPEKRDQGDPYVIQVPPEAETRFRYYVFTSFMEPYTGWAFLCYASNDLRQWTLLGESLRVDGDKATWAPCVTYHRTWRGRT